MAEPATAKRRWLLWALLASLAVNLATAGLVAGAILRGPPPSTIGPGLSHYARSLPEAYRRDLGATLRESRGDWIGVRRSLQDQRAAFAAAVTAEPFDPAAVEAALARQSEITDRLAARGADLLVAQISRMSPEERAAYAEAVLEDRRPRSHRQRR